MFDVGALPGVDVGVDLRTRPVREERHGHVPDAEGGGRAVPGHPPGGVGGLSRLDLLRLSHWMGRYVRACVSVCVDACVYTFML